MSHKVMKVWMAGVVSAVALCLSAGAYAQIAPPADAARPDSPRPPARPAAPVLPATGGGQMSSNPNVGDSGFKKQIEQGRLQSAVEDAQDATHKSMPGMGGMKPSGAFETSAAAAAQDIKDKQAAAAKAEQKKICVVACDSAFEKRIPMGLSGMMSPSGADLEKKCATGCTKQELNILKAKKAQHMSCVKSCEAKYK